MALSTASLLIMTSLLFNSLRFSRSQCQGQGSDLAANGATKQSSSASDATSAQKAIDGGPSVAQTKREAFPFWEIVLRGTSNISKINVYIDQLSTDCSESSYSVLLYDDACRLKATFRPVVLFHYLFEVNDKVNYARSVAIRCSNSSSSSSSLLPRLGLTEVQICGSEMNGGAASRSTTFCSETPFSASLQTPNCSSAVPTTTTTLTSTSDPPYNVNTITSSVMTSSFLSPTSVVHFTPLPTLSPPAASTSSPTTSSTSSPTTSTDDPQSTSTTPVPTSTPPTLTATRLPVVSENEFLRPCTNVKCALDAAQIFSNYVSGARAFANNVTLLQGASNVLRHYASLLENFNRSVNFSLANEFASLATKIGGKLTAAGRAGSSNENPATSTSVLRSIERIYAIAASTLKVEQEPITYKSTGRGRASNFASVIAAHNSNTGIPTRATAIEGLGFTSLDGILAASGIGVGESGAVIYSTFIIVGNDPFVSSRPNRRGVGSELVGLTLRRRRSDGNVTILTVGDLASDNEFAISWPRPSTTSSNRETVNITANTVVSRFVNLTLMIESDAFTVQFFQLPENVSGTIDVYFVQRLLEEPPLTIADLNDLNVSLSLNSSAKSSKLFYTGRDVNRTAKHYLVFRNANAQLVSVSFETFFTSCLFWNETELQYTSQGCRPSFDSTFDTTICLCNHLSFFGSDLFPEPNKLDFSLLANLNIAQNPVALATILVVLFFYVLAVIFARRADVRDFRYASQLSFCGPDGEYKYQISVFTSASLNSGTTANVGIRLYDESGASFERFLYREGAFRRNSHDMFLVETDQALDNIAKIEIWHDNDGKSPSWKLMRVIVEKNGTDQKFLFLYNNWLSLDSNTGLLIAEISAATTEEQKDFSSVFYAQRHSGFSDGHLWLSLVQKPLYSSFTRVQRITVCLSLLMSFMVVNAMWFRSAPKNPPDFNLGLISFSYSQIGISLMSVVLTAPINVMWLLFFRKAKRKTSTTNNSQKFRCQLPFYFVYVAYIGCFATTAFACVIVLIYGQSFGRAQAEKWVVTMLLSWLQSIFVVEPLKVLLIAVVFAVLFKRFDYLQNDAEIEQSLKRETHGVEASVRRLSETEKACALEQLQKRKHMMSTIYEIGLYLLFLWVALWISLADSNSLAKNMSRTTKDVFEAEKFRSIQRSADMFDWAKSSFVDALFFDEFYNGEKFDANFVRGDLGLRLAGAQIRQVRAAESSCPVLGYGPCYSVSKWEQRSFDIRWGHVSNKTVKGTDNTHWKHKMNLNGWGFSGIHSRYPASGYIHSLGENKSEARAVLAHLEDTRWIDRQTRVVFFEFSLYNANVNLFQTVQFVVEFLASGGLFPEIEIKTVGLIRYVTPTDYFKLAMEILFGLYTLAMTYSLLKEIRKRSWSIFAQVWFWFDFVVLCLSYSILAIDIYRTVTINSLLKRRQKRGVNVFSAVGFGEVAQQVTAILVFLAIIKVLKLLRFNRKLTMLSDVLRRTFLEVCSFLSIFALSLTAFTFLAALTLYNSSGFQSLTHSFTTLFEASLGFFLFGSWMEGGNGTLSTVVFVCYTLTTTFILLSTLVAILTLGFHETCSAIEQQKNDFEVIDYMWRSLKLSLGFSGSAKRKENSKQPSRKIKFSRTSFHRVALRLVSTSSIDYDEDCYFDELDAKMEQMVDLAQSLD